MEDKTYEWMIIESARGNKSAFRLLYESTKAEAFHFIRRRVGNREDAIEVLQDTFVDLWKALEKGKLIYSSDSEFRGFLYTILKRRIARFYRFRKVNFSFEDLETEAGFESDESETHHILSCLGLLGSTDQEILRLHYFSGQSFAEIANLLEVNEGAVKTRHHRALKKIRLILGYNEEN